MIKSLLITAGTLSMLIGIAGIFLPVLPTTPFFLLTAGLYLRSSEKLYNRFSGKRLTGYYTSKKSENVNPAVIFAATGIMWITIILAMILAENKPVVTILLLVAGIAGTIVKSGILYRHYMNRKQSNNKYLKT